MNKKSILKFVVAGILVLMAIFGVIALASPSADMTPTISSSDEEKPPERSATDLFQALSLGSEWNADQSTLKDRYIDVQYLGDSDLSECPTGARMCPYFRISELSLSTPKGDEVADVRMIQEKDKSLELVSAYTCESGNTMYGVPVDAGDREIGSETARYYTSESCDGYGSGFGNKLIWFLPDDKLVIEAYPNLNGEDEELAQEFEATLAEVLAGATWT